MERDDLESCRNKKSRASQVTEKPANHVLHTKRKFNRNDEIVGAMYAMYTTPDPDTGQLRSLSHIGRVYRKDRQTIYSLFKTRGYKLREKKNKDSAGVQSFRGIYFYPFKKTGSLRGTVGKKRVFMHIFVWQTFRGEIPKNRFIYHKDGNRSNNKISNLFIKDKLRKPNK